MNYRQTIVVLSLALATAGCVTYPSPYSGDVYDDGSYYSPANDDSGDYYYAPEPRYYYGYPDSFFYGSPYYGGYCSARYSYCPPFGYNSYYDPFGSQFGFSLSFGSGGWYDPYWSNGGYYGGYYGHGYDGHGHGRHPHDGQRPHDGDPRGDQPIRDRGPGEAITNDMRPAPRREFRRVRPQPNWVEQPAGASQAPPSGLEDAFQRAPQPRQYERRRPLPINPAPGAAPVRMRYPAPSSSPPQRQASAPAPVAREARSDSDDTRSERRHSSRRRD